MTPQWVAVLWLIGTTTAFCSDGEYLFAISGCLACHTAEEGPPLAGGRAFETPYGTFYSPNITPDPKTGIGRWTSKQFSAALRHGQAPDGSAYFPVFPYSSYQLMTEVDANKIFEYVLTRSPVQKQNREHKLTWWLSRWMMRPWQWWFQPTPPPPPADQILARGRYLADALGHCGECHTHKNRLGVADHSRYLAGTAVGPEGKKVPNITPNRTDGIGKWDADDLDYFLESGELPDGDYAGSLMTEVIDNATSKLTAADRSAMVAYLKSVPALPGP